MAIHVCHVSANHDSQVVDSLCLEVVITIATVICSIIGCFGVGDDEMCAFFEMVLSDLRKSKSYDIFLRY